MWQGPEFLSAHPIEHPWVQPFARVILSFLQSSKPPREGIPRSIAAVLESISSRLAWCPRPEQPLPRSPVARQPSSSSGSCWSSLDLPFRARLAFANRLRLPTVGVHGSVRVARISVIPVILWRVQVDGVQYQASHRSA